MVHVKHAIDKPKMLTCKTKKAPDNAGDSIKKKRAKVKKKSPKSCDVACNKVKADPECVSDNGGINKTKAEYDKSTISGDLEEIKESDQPLSNCQNAKDPYAFDIDDEDVVASLPHISQKRTLKQLPLHFEGSISQNNLTTIAAAAVYTERMHEVYGHDANKLINTHFNGEYVPVDHLTDVDNGDNYGIRTSSENVTVAANEICLVESSPNFLENVSDSLVFDAQTTNEYPNDNSSLRRCPKCGRMLKTEKSLEKHIVSCSRTTHRIENASGLPRKSKQPFYCEQCDFKSSRKLVVAKHMESEHGLYKCLKVRCLYVGESKQTLDMHLLQMHKASLPEAGIRYCKKCGQHIQTDEALFDEHVSTCRGKDPFVCKQCNKEFTYKFAYTNHMNSHFPEHKKKFQCTNCDYSSNFKANLHKHVHCIHEQRSRDVICPKCGKTFFTDESMKRHLKLHSDIRPFQCPVCEKSFKTRMSLREHEQIHIEGRPFVCTYNGCQKDFRSMKFLKRHQLEFHNVEPPKFSCQYPECDISFFRQCQLAKHERTHDEGRTFTCSYPDCGKEFRHADNLKVHNLMHTNEKPIKCELCDYSCRQRSALNYHMSRNHSAEPITANHKDPSSVAMSEEQLWDESQKAVSDLLAVTAVEYDSTVNVKVEINALYNSCVKNDGDVATVEDGIDVVPDCNAKKKKVPTATLR